MRARTMLEDIDALPRPERHPTVVDRDRQLRQGERGADVGGHVVWPFNGVPVKSVVLRRETAEELIEIVHNVRIGVFLHRQRCGRVLDKQGEETGLHILHREPARDGIGKFVQTFAPRFDLDPMHTIQHTPMVCRGTEGNCRRP